MLGETVEGQASKKHDGKYCISADEWKRLYKEGIALLIALGAWLTIATIYCCIVCTTDDKVLDGWFGEPAQTRTEQCASTVQTYELMGSHRSRTGREDLRGASGVSPIHDGYSTCCDHCGATTGQNPAAVTVPASAVPLVAEEEDPDEGPATRPGVRA